MAETLLVVTNAYPSETDPYRNGFVHRRVQDYVAAGLEVEVFVHHGATRSRSSYEYGGVQVVKGTPEDYERHLRDGDFAGFLMHFATEAMTRPIVELHPGKFLIAWIHGFEAEAWHRRWFNFSASSKGIRHALVKKSSYYEGQNRFIRWLISTDEYPIDIVHVSQWFKENIVEPDVGVVTRNSYVVPNFIDTQLFEYRQKQPQDRLKILSLRPYASRKYANDLTVRAIQELSRRTYFDQLSFTIRGDGPLFEEVTEPLHEFENVQVTRGLLEQHAIPELHREHGVFLAPTRFDSQGVSMCEAMSSGLVPVTNEIAAIPEYVSDFESGLLAPPEDHVGLADRIERLYYNADLFLALSQGASTSVRAQCGAAATTAREIEIIQERLRVTNV